MIWYSLVTDPLPWFAGASTYIEYPSFIISSHRIYIVPVTCLLPRFSSVLPPSWKLKGQLICGYFHWTLGSLGWQGAPTILRYNSTRSTGTYSNAAMTSPRYTLEEVISCSQLVWLTWLYESLALVRSIFQWAPFRSRPSRGLCAHNERVVQASTQVFRDRNSNSDQASQEVLENFLLHI